MKTSHSVSMSSGPQLYSFRHSTFFYGGVHLLSFEESDRGRELHVEVDTGGRPLCWIELWPGLYTGQDWVTWTTERGQQAVARTGDRPQTNPSLIWKVEPGKYTVYFVASSSKRTVSQ
ncbi:hypothetical protein EG829_29535, partial [bacterium]|nr:hypothetical protein [bacterium]